VGGWYNSWTSDTLESKVITGVSQGTVLYAPWPRPPPMGGSRTERPATGPRGLHLPTPLAGTATNRPRGFATEGRSFDCRPLPSPTAPRPRRPSPVGGGRTKRPAPRRCGLRLQSPLAGAASNRAWRFRPTEGRSFQLPAASEPPCPTAAAIARGWRSHRTPGNWTLRASLAKPPGGGCTEPPPAVSHPKAAVSNCRPPQRPNALGRGHRPWVEAAQNARQLEVAGFVCQAPCGGCGQPPRRFRRRRPQFSTAGRVEPHRSPRHSRHPRLGNA